MFDGCWVFGLSAATSATVARSRMPLGRSGTLPAGSTRSSKEGVEFARYLTEEGWHIIPIKAADQLVRHIRCLLWLHITLMTFSA